MKKMFLTHPVHMERSSTWYEWTLVVALGWRLALPLLIGLCNRRPKTAPWGYLLPDQSLISFTHGVPYSTRLPLVQLQLRHILVSNFLVPKSRYQKILNCWTTYSQAETVKLECHGSRFLRSSVSRLIRGGKSRPTRRTNQNIREGSSNLHRSKDA